MSRGKHLSLEEARKHGLLDQFAQDNPNEADAELFERLTKAMASGKTPEELETSGDPASED